MLDRGYLVGLGRVLLVLVVVPLLGEGEGRGGIRLMFRLVRRLLEVGMMRRGIIIGGLGIRRDVYSIFV